MDWHWLLSLFTSERIIAFATAGYLVVTVVMFLQIRRQGKILERQTKLQEAGFRQWVTTTDWQVVHADESGEVIILLICFRIANTTQFPLTIDKVVVDERGTTACDLGMTYTIPPNGIVPVDVVVSLSQDDRELYLADQGAFMPLDVKISYTDCLGKFNSHDFSVDCNFYRTKASSFEIRGSVEQKKEAQKGK